MKHTFLFEEGLWLLKGRYIDGSGRSFPVTGEVRILHQEGLWINESRMALEADKPAEYQNRYEIVPFAAGREATTWVSFSAALGTLEGQFILAEDALLSLYQSESKAYQGMEVLLQQDPRLYQNRGCLLQGKQKVSTWVVTLTRTAEAEGDDGGEDAMQGCR